MWLPIIHNLQSSDPAYAAAQHYNALIGNKPKCADMTLDQKIETIRLWQAQCSTALDDVKEIMKNDTTL